MRKITVTVRYGIANTLEREFDEGTTVGQVLDDRNIMLALGVGSNVVGKINGATVERNKTLTDGDELDVEVRANTKALISLMAMILMTRLEMAA